jgi:hypothetical protein
MIINLLFAAAIAMAMFGFSTIFDGRYENGNMRKDIPSTIGFVLSIILFLFIVL